jgi:hypothetical protein
MTAKKRLLAILALMLATAGNAPFILAETDGAASKKSTNQAAATRSLERATTLLAAADWDAASFEARLGETYDPSLADFPYIEALALAVKKAPRADILERVEASLADGLFWRTYSRAEARVFAAKLMAETCRYSEALSLLGKAGGLDSADAEYVRAVSFYGLGRKAEARASVSRALDRWPFDARFPRVFLVREKGSPTSSDAARIAQTILSRLYVWQDEDRELLLLAVPFESNPETRVRDIRTFRSMGKNDNLAEAAVRRAAESYGETPAQETSADVGTGNTAADSKAAQHGSMPGGSDASTGYIGALSTVYALEYGIIDEATAERELFQSEKDGIPLTALHGLCSLVGKKDVRASIETRLDGFEGIITDDANSDGIVDSWIRYRLGRPVEASFDANQDGYPDYAVACDLGEPAVITVRNPAAVVSYDRYPAVRSVREGEREFTLKPLALSWAPVEWVREDFGFDGNAFYTIKTTAKAAPLTDRLLANTSAFYVEDGKTRVVLEGGVPLSSETREDGRVVSWTSYARGFPSLTKADFDGDGYFETTSSYTAQGALASVEVDRNGNRRAEYREEYASDGTVVKRWDSDENGIFEIVWTKTPDGIERTQWIHPDTGLPVVITVEKGAPREVSYGGSAKPIVRDPTGDIWWIGRLPPNAREIAKKIGEAFNEPGPPIVSYSVNVDGKRLNAVRTGGLFFAELVDE